MKRPGIHPALFLAAAALVALSPAVLSQEATSCVTCHSDADLFEEEQLKIVELFQEDVHASVGLSCHDCHGGDSSLDVADDNFAAMDEGFAANPYKGPVERAKIPSFCGSCHSDPEYMRRFRPDVRVDQEREYWTSHHGEALKAGRTGAATCVDCHSVHDIRKVEDAQSPVYPTHVADTCGGCHGNPEHMAGVTLPDGRPLPTDQAARWRSSVHANAMFAKGDLTAPTCNDCHGNHGAQPPGVESIAFICGQCHGREADLFRKSAKHAKLEEHATYLEDAGEEGCAACHTDPDPQARQTVRYFRECASCHGNHGVVRPTVAMLGPLPETPCAFCHEGSGPLADETIEPQATIAAYEAKRDTLLEEARGKGFEGIDLFDHLVDRALLLESHNGPPVEEGEEPVLRPEFKRLFEKFRIGKSYYTFEDPVSGTEARGDVIRCVHCHGAEPSTGAEPKGFETASTILDRMQQVTSRTGMAERTLLRARRGGVETREALADIDAAVDAQIGLEVLVHTFDIGEGSPFVEKHAEGVESANAALAAGEEALGELQFRRKGLAVSLVFVVLVAIGLAMKIREVSRREAEAARAGASS